ncbi:MAG: YeiH family putative sulfate export transporter [Proteobacteria bacterium]|nr:YeiH family putative sulfate export transporter [Pseudomonadota bacterium]
MTAMTTNPWRARLPGLLLAAALAIAAMLLEPWTKRFGMSALPTAIVLGILLGNTVFPRISGHAGAGVDYARSRLLRVGIVLFGFRLTFQDIVGVGATGIVVDVIMVTLTFLLALFLGRRVFKLDRDSSILIGSGAAICGAAAVMAAEPVVKAQAHKVSVAVATVVVFGTIAMFLYPLFWPLLQSHHGFTQHAFGLYVGSSVHEVAQVVVAGKSVGDEAANIAVIEKMIRVILLAPFLLLLSAWLRDKNDESGKRAPIVIPWFAILFLLVGAFNSFHLLPKALVDALLLIDTFLLAMAMGALGVRTHAGAIRQAGLKPLLLATTLFAWLIVGGLLVNIGVARLFGH